MPSKDYEYDSASQLLGATRKDAATWAVQKQYTYRYDLASNRTLEQIGDSRDRGQAVMALK